MDAKVCVAWTRLALHPAPGQLPVDGRRAERAAVAGQDQRRGRGGDHRAGIRSAKRCWNGDVGRKPAVSWALVWMTRSSFWSGRSYLRSSRSASLSPRSLSGPSGCWVHRSLLVTSGSPAAGETPSRCARGGAFWAPELGLGSRRRGVAQQCPACAHRMLSPHGGKVPRRGESNIGRRSVGGCIVTDNASRPRCATHWGDGGVCNSRPRVPAWSLPKGA